MVHVREQVKRVMRECFECARRFRSKPAHQQMAPLPNIRLQQSSRPFESCAVDFGGPFLTKQGRGRVREKCYLCLFLCLKTHCCHLEMASSLVDTDAFLNAFVRMTARRGWPQQMLSDNGTNFVSASRELRDLVSAIDQDKLQRMTSNKGVSWKWNPPAAPRFGGVFESMMKSAKQAIFAVLGDARCMQVNFLRLLRTISQIFLLTLMTPRYIYLSSRTLLQGNRMLSLLFKIAFQILEVG